MRNKIKKIVVFIVLFSFFSIEFHSMYTVYASDLRFYNYSTGATVNYKDKQITYTYNSRELPLTYPGILINGTALADYEELFVHELGLNADLNGDTVTISDGTTKIKLTLGSKKVYINDKEHSMSVAPVKLKFNNDVKYYVPTRFVAEALGYGYVWVSNISTVRITKTIPLSVNGANLLYNGTLYSVKYNDTLISSDMPVIYYKGEVVVPAQQIFEAAGCDFTEDENIITVSKNELSLYLKKESKIAYVNEKKIIGNSAPTQILNDSTNKSEWYLSLEFISDMLGFELVYSDKEKCYSLIENEMTGKIALYPDLVNGMWQKTVKTEEQVEEQAPEHIYFEWVSNATGSTEQKYLSKVLAYHIDEMDVVELYGISAENINDFFDSGMIFFELNDVCTDLETEFFSAYDASHLNYTLLSVLSTNIKLICMIPPESTWQIVEKDNFVRIYFIDSNMSVENLEIFSSKSESYPENACSYPDDRIIIPLHNTMEKSHFSDEDIYSSKYFKINIIGNYVEYFKQNPIINPYYGVSISEPKYDIVNNLTTLGFYTNSICGYSYTFEDGYLALNIGKPNEIYSKIIVFDAGHGGIDPGAIKNGIYEKNITFKIINTYVKELFEASDIKVYFTREKDIKVDLYERAAFASEVGADMFISLHLNAHNSSSIRGTEVFYSKDNNESSESGFNSYKLAKALSENLSIAMDTRNRGATKNDFVVIKYNTVPAVLIELGYMTNATELTKLKDTAYQQKAAKTIYDTVIQLYNDYFLR